MNSNLYNIAETALASQRPVAGQYPVPATTVNAAREAAGVGGVPNALAGAAGALNPYGAILGGIGDAIGAPPPSLTATVNAHPSLKYGDNYISNLVGQNKAGSSFVVTSGSSEAKSEAGSASTDNAGKTNMWIIAAIGGALFLVFFALRK